MSFATTAAVRLSLIAVLSTTTATFAFVPTRPTTSPRAKRAALLLSMPESPAAGDDAATTSLSPDDRHHPCAVVPRPPPTASARGVIFDIDGTLADSWRLGYDATVVVLQNNDFGHIDMNEELYHATCVYPTPERLARTAGLLPTVDDNFDALGTELGRQFDEHYVALVSPTTCAFYDGVLDMLQNLPSTTKLGALTNACVAYGHAVLKVNCPARSALDNTYAGGLFSLYNRFGTIHGADSVPRAKPHPDGLLQCAAELGLDPAECLYVGDAVGDGKAARAAGMVSVGVLWGSNSEEKLRAAETFDYLCSSREELRELLPQQ